MDLRPEHGFVFSIIEYVFSINKCHVPSSLMNHIYENGGRSNRFLSAIVRRSIEVIIQAQKKIFSRVCRETVELYYKEKLVEHFTEREFLEFLGFHARNCLLDCIDIDTAKPRNPSDAIKIYNLVMNVIKDSKKLNWFTLNEAKLNAAAKEIVDEGLKKYTNKLEKLCKIMISVASEKAKSAQSSRTIYVMTETGKIESKMERLESVDDPENTVHEKKNEDALLMTQIVKNDIKEGKEKKDIEELQEFNDSDSANIVEVAEGGRVKDLTKSPETDRIRREIMEAMQDAPKRQRVEIESADIVEVAEGGRVKDLTKSPDTDRIRREIMEAMQDAPKRQRLEIQSKTGDILKEAIFNSDSDVQEKIFISDSEILQEVIFDPNSKTFGIPGNSQKIEDCVSRRTEKTNFDICEVVKTEILGDSIGTQERTNTETREVKKEASKKSMKKENGKIENVAKSSASDDFLKNARHEENRKVEVFETEEYVLKRPHNEKSSGSYASGIQTLVDSKIEHDRVTREVIEAMQDAPKRSRN